MICRLWLHGSSPGRWGLSSRQFCGSCELAAYRWYVTGFCWESDGLYQPPSSAHLYSPSVPSCCL